MGRSVSYPADAQVAFRSIEDDGDWRYAYDELVDDVRDRAREAFPSFELAKGWRDREDRILLRNSFAELGVSTYGGLAAIWIVEREDLEDRERRGWPELTGLARQWLAKIAPKFEEMFGELELLGSSSNGESFYREREAA